MLHASFSLIDCLVLMHSLRIKAPNPFGIACIMGGACDANR